MALDSGKRGQVTPPRRKRKPSRSQTPAPAPRRSSPPPPPSYGQGRSVERPGSSSQVRNPRSLRSYPFLRANSGINWRDVNPSLLSTLNRLGRETGAVITLTSGFRTHAEQRYLYQQYLAGNIGLAAPPGQSNHEHGNAIDAVVNGVPIASAIDEGTLNRHGLKSLAHANDPVHVELIEPGDYTAPGGGGGDYTPPRGTGSSGVSAQEAASLAYVAPTSPTVATPGPSVQPEVETAEPAVLPFEANPDEQPAFFSPQQRAETWQLIAQLPGASPETQQLARLASLSIGG